MLLRDSRIGDLAINPRDKSIWGLRHQNGYATVVRIPPPYAGFNQIHTFDYGITPFDLDISPDGTLISASYGEIDGTQSVRVWKLQTFEQGAGPEGGPARPSAGDTGGLYLLPTENRSTGRATIPAHRTSSASTSPARNMKW